MRARAGLPLIIAFALSLTACGGNDPAPAAPSPDDASTTAPAPTTTAVATTAPVATTAAADTTTATEPVEGVGEPLFDGFDRQISLLTATSGGGGRPLLEWEPLPGADHYAVFVYGPSGEVYWAWTGAEASVHVGGEPQLNDGASGPSVAAGMSWAVIAYGTDLLPMAVSEQREISP